MGGELFEESVKERQVVDCLNMTYCEAEVHRGGCKGFPKLVYFLKSLWKIVLDVKTYF